MQKKLKHNENECTLLCIQLQFCGVCKQNNRNTFLKILIFEVIASKYLRCLSHRSSDVPECTSFSSAASWLVCVTRQSRLVFAF